MCYFRCAMMCVLLKFRPYELPVSLCAVLCSESVRVGGRECGVLCVLCDVSIVFPGELASSRHFFLEVAVTKCLHMQGGPWHSCFCFFGRSIPRARKEACVSVGVTPSSSLSSFLSSRRPHC